MLDTHQTRERPPAPPGARQPTIVVEHLSKWYGDVVAVSDVSFHVEPGVTGLLGPNGAGKSTILKTLSGLLAPSTGSVRVLGQPVRGNPAIYRQIGLVPEQEGVYPFLTGREFVRLNAVMQQLDDPEAAVRAVLALVELERDADRAVRGYSKGMRQRIKIAGGLVHDPEVLILDEPLTGTDPVQRLRLMELIRRLGDEGKTVLVSSHVLHEVERVADRILVLVDGKLAAAGDYRAIRDQIDEHARMVRVRAGDIRGLMADLVGQEWLETVRFEGDGAAVLETNDVRALYRALPAVAQRLRIRLYEIAALDESLSSVFAYVTER
ncbi:MAG TPA: ABC transporter ATP-binding protein [Thermomicrobiaceae bacterium]|nr:ABC transporter ATP-binding protein [Thermomicrobiaceae bacterium]